MKNFALLILTPFIISACSHLSEKKSKMHDVDQIAVVAVFDQTLVTSLNGKEGNFDVLDWPTNQTISNEMIVALKNLKKTAFELQTDPQVIQTGKDEALDLKNIYLGNRYQALERYLVTEAAKQGAKYLFVVHPASHPAYGAYSPGYGFFCRTQGNLKMDLQGYFLMSAELWDVQTNEIIARTALTPGDLNFATGKACGEIARIKPDQWIPTYQNEILGLARKSAGMILQRTEF